MAAGKFSFMDIVNAQSKAAAGEAKVENYTEIYLNPYEVKPSNSNFYSQQGIEELADSFLAVGQQQPTVLGRINGEWRIISGHRRNLANQLLIQRGYDKYKSVRYLYKDMTEATFELSLLVGNAFNRELTPYEKTEQAARLKKALIRARDEDGLELQGKLRDIVADLLGESGTNVARMDKINSDLVPEAKEEFKKGNMGITAAYETSKLPEEDQRAIAKAAAAGEDVRAKEIAKRVAEQVAAKAQEKADKAAEKAEKAEIEAQQAIADAMDKKAEAEEEARNARELKRYVDTAAEALETAKNAAEAAVHAISNVSETDTTQQENWSNLEWVRYTLCCLMEQAEKVSEDDLYKLQEILINCEGTKEEVAERTTDNGKRITRKNTDTTQHLKRTNANNAK